MHTCFATMFEYPVELSFNWEYRGIPMDRQPIQHIA